MCRATSAGAFRHGLFLLWAFALLLAGLPAAAQERAFELSQQTVLALHQDAAGDLWIGTEDGLNHLQGGRITQYRHDANDAASLPGNKIRAIASGPSGSLWIAIANEGVVLWDTAGWVIDHRSAAQGTAQGNDPRAFLENADGSVWAGFSKGGLELLDPRGAESRLRRRAPRVLADSRVTALARGPEGLLWVGTPSGVELFNPASRTSQRCAACEMPPVRSLRSTQHGLFVGTTEGAFLMSRNTSTGALELQAVYGATTRVNTVTEDSSGQVWVGTSRGLQRVDMERLEVRDVNQAQARGGVLAIHEDRDGQIWLGTMTGGLQPLVEQGALATVRSAAATQAPMVVTSFSEGPGHVFVGTMGSGLIVQDAKGRTLARLNSKSDQPLSDDTVMALLYDRQGYLWVGTKSGGLNRVDSKGGKAKVFTKSPLDPNSLPADGVMSLYEDSLGSLWVGTFGGGLSRYDQRTGNFRTFSSEQGLTSDRVTCIAGASRGGLWVGTLGGGLHLLDSKRRVVGVLSGNDGILPSSTIFSVHEDRSGTIWVGTPAGLTRVVAPVGSLAKAKARTYTEVDGLSNTTVYSVVPDDQGYLWLSTNRGLSRFDPTRNLFEVYGEGQGFQREYNFGAAMKGGDGRLFFGGMEGYDSFDPRAPLGSPVDRMGPRPGWL